MGILGVVLRVVALASFVAAAANQVIFSQGELDLVAWGLAAFVASILVDELR